MSVVLVWCVCDSFRFDMSVLLEKIGSDMVGLNV